MKHAPKQRQGVQVQRKQADHNDWAWSTIESLFEVKPDDNPGKDSIIENFFRIGIAGPRDFGLLNAFANPEFLVIADNPSSGFLRASRITQHTWFRRVKAILGSSGAVKRNTMRMSPIIRQLSYTGVMIIDGKHVFPNQWPQTTKKGGARKK